MPFSFSQPTGRDKENDLISKVSILKPIQQQAASPRIKKDAFGDAIVKVKNDLVVTIVEITEDVCYFLIQMRSDESPHDAS